MDHRGLETDPTDAIRRAMFLLLFWSLMTRRTSSCLTRTRIPISALRLAETLADMGIGSWMFETKINLRSDIADSVREAVTRAEAVVVLVTRQSIASLWVLTEMHTCLKVGWPLCSSSTQPTVTTMASKIAKRSRKLPRTILISVIGNNQVA